MIWGWTISAAVLAPNLIWMMLPPPDVPIRNDPPSKVRVLVGLVEQAGRVAVITVPVFYDFQMTRLVDRMALAVMMAALGIYYAGWGRYFRRGRRYRLLFLPLGWLPVPLAISPVIAVLSAAVQFHSWLLAAVVATFGVVHISSSLRET